MRKLLFILLGLTAILPGFVHSQKNLKKAQKQYELKAFELAAYNYNLALEEDPSNPDIMAGLASCFHYMNNDLEAIKFYKQAEEHGYLTEEDLSMYGNSLKKVGKYKEAKNVFHQLKTFNPIVGEHYILSCDYAEKLLKLPMQFDVSPFGGNTVSSDYAVTPFKDKWVFSSFRNDIKELNADDDIMPVSRIFATGNIQSKYTSVSLLRSPMKSSKNMGPISYSSDGYMAAVQISETKEGYLPVFKGDENHRIMLANVDKNGDFYDETPFPHNEVGSSAAFPCLAFNGSALYFSSNRSDGYGGFDLYVSYNKNGKWTLPENLGANVNSPGNEITPYFDGHTLYFSSDYIHGLGGYDVFKTVPYMEDWSFPENLGNGINSPGDDLYPYVDNIRQVTYVSSNRLGGNGNLDIYKITKLQNNDEINLVTMEPQVPMVSLVSDNYSVKTIDEPENSLPADELDDINEEQVSLDTTTKPKAIVLPTEEDNIVNKGNWEGARMVAFNESMLNGSKVFFIQLAALSKTSGEIERFRNLSKFGNIYKMNQARYTKIRLGYFLDESEARQVLKTVKSYGFNDAFIIKQPLNTAEMELVMSDAQTRSTDSYMVPGKYGGNSSYKVRLASYEDPIWFEINKAKDLGKIEQWTKGDWTIFVLSGYNSLEEAQRARVKAINKGFMDAEVVFDNDGILERLKKN